MSLYSRWMLKRLRVTQTHPVSVRRGIRVRTPDGVELATDVYLGSGDESAPVVMIRSPYGISATFAARTAYPLAAQGFNVVMQSCRGTFGSTGRFDPHHDEHRDGLATLAWIKQQPWCNGSIATHGPSYLGYTQWAVAAAAGPEVKAMAMQVTVSDFSRMTYGGGSFALKQALTWTQMVTWMRSPKGLLRLIVSRLLRKPAARDERWLTLPLSSLDAELIGERVGFWQDWVRHDSSEDPWWAPMSFRSSIGDIERPITMVAGWYDIFLPWQMQDFGALREAGCEARITVGPWRHNDDGLWRAGLRDAIDWFDLHLRNKKGASAGKAVRLYVIGADEWREFDAWPPRETRLEQWYLHPQRKLAAEVPRESDADEYRYDPTDPTPSVGGPALEAEPYSVDNAALEARSDVLTYTSEPLPAARDLIGAAVAELFVSSSAQSADFFVRLCDVDANGSSRNVCDGLQRISVEVANTPQRVRVELWPTAYRIAKGHRIRIQISSGAFPRWARNLGSAEPIAVATQAFAATQRIHHSPACSSAVVLPFSTASGDALSGTSSPLPNY